MIILDELRYLSDLFIKNARRLLHLLSTSAHDGRTNITKILQQYSTLIFVDVPARVHQTMVNFNRWLAKVLEVPQSKCIEQRLELNNSPWLTLDEPLAPDRSLNEAFTANDTSTFQLLKTACVFYMTRCENLHQTNVDLSTQVAKLTKELKQALYKVKVEEDLLSSSNCDTTSSEQDPNLEENGVNDGCYTDGNLLPHRQEALPDSRLWLDLDSSVSKGKSMSRCDDGDFQQLVALQASGEKTDSWFRQALSLLTAKREQRQLLSKSKTEFAERPFVKVSASRAHCRKEVPYDTQEFLQLVSFRENVEDNEDSTWYRRALQHLKNERVHRAAFRDRDSEASTVSIAE